MNIKFIKVKQPSVMQLAAIVVVAVLLLDQVVKFWVKTNMLAFSEKGYSTKSSPQIPVLLKPA